MCEDKFLVKTTLSRNNVIEHVFVEPFRCGLKIVKKGHDWKCLDLNKAAAKKLLRQQQQQIPKSDQRASSVKNTGTIRASVGNTGIYRNASITAGKSSVKNTGRTGESVAGAGAAASKSDASRRVLTGTQVDKQLFPCNQLLKKQLEKKGAPETKSEEEQYSTLLSLLNSGNSCAPPTTPAVPNCKRATTASSCEQLVQVKQEPGTGGPPPPNLERHVFNKKSAGNFNSRQSDKESQTTFKKPRKPKKKPIRNSNNNRGPSSDLLLTTLLGPDPVLRLQLANWFMVPVDKGSGKFSSLHPPPRPVFPHVSKLKMLFDEDGTGDSGDPQISKAKAPGGEDDSDTSPSTGKRGRELEDDEDVNSDVADTVKKVKVEQPDADLNNDDEGEGEGSRDHHHHQNDQNSNESFSNKQNGLDDAANLRSNGGSFKTGDSSEDSSPSRDSTQEESNASSSNNTKKPSSSNQQSTTPRRSNFSQCLAANRIGASAAEDKKENGFNNSVTVSKTVGKSNISSSVNSSASAASKLRNSLVEAGNSTAGSSVASSSNNSESGENTKVLQLEREIASLGSLLNAKEREWNAILELKKLKELAIEYYRRQKDVEALCDEEAIQEHDDYLKRLTARISALSDKIGPDEAQVRASTTKTEKEIQDAGKNLKIVNGQAKKNASEDKKEEATGDGDAVKMENFQASLALQQLCERNKALSQVTPVLSPGASSATNKVIGEGRQGAIVEVRSIIADYRSKNPDDGTITGNENRKRNSKKQSTVVNNVSNILSQNRNASFRDILVNLAKLSQNEKNGIPTISVASEITKPTTKNSSAGAGQSNSNRGSMGTLAKLLSSNNGGSAVDDGSNGRSDTLTVSNGGDNISLANLLAGSSRPRDDDLNAEDEEMVPVCQGCNNSRAQFVCAGCGNQWYCSRECQVTAWEHHSEVCSG